MAISEVKDITIGVNWHKVRVSKAMEGKQVKQFGTNKGNQVVSIKVKMANDFNTASKSKGGGALNLASNSSTWGKGPQ